jgi:hypothetical protein
MLLLAGEYDWRDGFVSGAVYNYNPDLIKLLTEVYGQASYTNPLHPDVFPGVCKMEAEVVRITANLFHGGSKSCGTVRVYFGADFLICPQMMCVQLKHFLSILEYCVNLQCSYFIQFSMSTQSNKNQAA